MRLRVLLPASILSCSLAGAAFAGPTSATEPKQPLRAHAYSIGATVVGLGAGVALFAADQPVPGIAVGLSGALVGPSTGLWYAGELGGKGILLRAGALTLMSWAFLVGSNLRPADCFPDLPPGECESRERSYRNSALLYTGLFLSGAGVYLASSVYDMFAAGRAARRRNTEHRLRLGPTAMRTRVGAMVPGVEFSLAF